VASHLAAGNALTAQLRKAIAATCRAKDTYFDACSAYEKAESLFNPSSDQSEKQGRSLAQARSQSKQAADRYILSIEQANALWDEHDRLMPDIMLTLQQNYEGRIHFLKYTLERLVKNMSKQCQQEAKVYADLTTALGNINSNADIRVFVDSLRGKSVGVTRERFVAYEEHKKHLLSSLRNEEDFLILDGSDTDDDLLRATKVLNHLFSLGSRDLKPDDRALTQSLVASMTDALETKEGRVAFIDVLLAMRDSAELTPESFNHIAGLFSTLLNAIQTQNDRDAGLLYRVITLAESLSVETVGKRRYLTQFISSHPIWSDFRRWQSAIDAAISTRLTSDRQSLERIRKRKEGSVKGFLRAFKSFTTKLPTFQREQPEEMERSAAALVLSQFGTYLRDFEVPSDFACEVLLVCGQRARLDGERVCALLTELQASQVHAGSDLQLTTAQKSLKKREEERVYWKEIMPLGLALPYLELEDLRTILHISRRVTLLTHKPIMRLLLLDRKESRISREKLWLAALRPYALSADYSSELQAVAFAPLPKAIEDVIANDVVRSFQFAPTLSKDPLTNILRAYAHFNPAVGYCQGMNYLFGTLYIIYKNEEAAFTSGVGLINRYQMSSIFYTQLPRLKVMFYQLDRMLARFLPRLQALFRTEGISASHFSSPWFMTLFASSLQSDEKKFEVLLMIWDEFILKGWKVVFKAAIAVLIIVEPMLLDKPFDQVMSLLTSISSPICPHSIFTPEFLSAMAATKVTNSLLRSLEAEYEHLKLRSGRNDPS
jgi:hypothetical protein